jgi:hypothetical protein
MSVLLTHITYSKVMERGERLEGASIEEESLNHFAEDRV